MIGINLLGLEPMNSATKFFYLFIKSAIRIQSTSIPPIVIMNRMYENQNLLYIVPLMRHTIVVWINNIRPMAMGCFICVNIS